MSKFSNKSKLSDHEQKELLIELCQSVAAIKKSEEAAQFLQDLLSSREAEMLAKRVKIAKLLLDGMTYEEVQEILKVGSGTVARVSTWLSLSGEGFRLVADRTRAARPPSAAREAASHSWRMMKKRYPLHLWPEILIEEIVNSASIRQKDRLIKILDRLDDKDEAFLALSRMIAQGSRSSD